MTYCKSCAVELEDESLLVIHAKAGHEIGLSDGELNRGVSMPIHTLTPMLFYDKLLTQREVAQLLGCSVKTLQIMRRAHRLPFLRFGHRTIRFRESEVSKFVEAAQESQR